MKIRKISRYIIIFSLAGFIILVVNAGEILVFKESPHKADVIIVLSGGPGRLEKAAELYDDGYANYMILTNSNEMYDKSGNMIQSAKALSIPQNAILTENLAKSTFQNAEYTLPIMEDNGFTKAIVVSSDYHMRRVKFLFNHVYKNSGIELNFIGSESGYRAKTWWKDVFSREITLNEYIKLIGNAFGYNGQEAKNTFKIIKHLFR